ncbi:MAG: DUF1376 domain-containing protein [Gemmatimonadetes bacterium]|nr:DUF1376 domain-containing protein [Gemmatimonadota bacterium]
MSNSGFPWFPFYVRDWLTDVKVMSMSCCARGAFIQLLALQWENGGLPPEWDDLAALTGYQDGYEDLERQLGPLFPPTDDGRRNPRLEELRQEKLDKRAAQAAGAASTHVSNAKRRAKQTAKQLVRASEDHDADTDAEKKKTSVRKRPGALKGPTLFERFWNFYPRRNEKRVGKKATLNRWKRLSDDDKEALWKAARHYAQSKIARVDGKARDPERFLKDDYWRDWLDGPGTDVHVEERDKPRPAPKVDPGGPPADPDDVAAELGHGSFREATRALSMDERLKKEEGR